MRTIIDTRGTEFGWLVAQVIPYLLANPARTVICDPLMKGFFYIAGYHRKVIEGKKLEGHIPDMLGPNLRRILKIATDKGTPILRGDKKQWDSPTAVTNERISIHARMIDRHPERNWSKDKWDDLVSRLPLGSRAVGVKPSDYLPKWAVDGRRDRGVYGYYGLPAPPICIGASSGPMHLAQMLGIPVVVWSGNPGKDRHRYEKAWNLKGSPVAWAGDTWDPSVDDVLEAFFSCQDHS